MLVVKIVGLQINKEINRFGLKAQKDANTQLGLSLFNKNILGLKNQRFLKLLLLVQKIFS